MELFLPVAGVSVNVFLIITEVVSIAGNSAVEIETVIKKGDPAEEITKYAKADNNVVLVGIGHIGRGMTARRVLGSVAYLLVNEVSRAMPCPVMVISSGECKYFKGGGILVASDGSIPSLHALRNSIGASGKHLTAKRLLGSVTEGVLNQLGKEIICPVVVVPGVDEVIHERLGI